jgi:cytoskeletal protein RodZ
MPYRGKSLKALRETKQVDLRSISNETRISVAYLEDLEEERFDRFPGKFYFKSFAREYVRVLGVEDVEEVTSDLVHAYEVWSGAVASSGSAPMPEPATPNEEGIFHRIASMLRRAEEA